MASPRLALLPITLPPLVASLLLLLTGCDDSTSSSKTNAEATMPTVSQEPVDQIKQGLAGVWQPHSTSDLKALVLEDDGQLYLVGDSRRRGISWQRQDDDSLRLNYLLRNGAGKTGSDTVTAELDKDALTLHGDSPLAGDYRRDDQGIETLAGTAKLPASVPVTDRAVLAITLRDLDTGDPDLEGVVNRRLARLHPNHDKVRFRLYFERQSLQPGHRYGISARVIADGAVRLISDKTLPLASGTDTSAPITITLHPPDHGANGGH